MSLVRKSDHRREPPGPAARGVRRAAGAVRWLALTLALAVLAAAAALSGAGLTAAPALAGTTVTVANTADETTGSDGACSLREAISYAQRLNGTNHDCGTTATGTTTINVPAGSYDVPAAGADAHLQVGSGGPGPIVINGAGQGATVIDAQGFPRLLLVAAGANLTLTNLTLQGGREQDVYVSGYLSFHAGGGGIYNLGTLTLDHVTVTGNQTWEPASDGSPFPAVAGDARGGGIFNAGTLVLLSSEVSVNSTAPGLDGFDANLLLGGCARSGSPAGQGADGGGIYNQAGTVTAVNTTITGNTTGGGGSGGNGQDSREARVACTAGGNGGPGAHGGAGGGIFNNDGIVNLRQSAVYGNTTGAGGVGGAGGYGSNLGGFGAQGGGGGGGAGIASNGMLTVTDTTITGNVTGAGGAGGTGGGSDLNGTRPAGVGGAGGPGGAIYQDNGQSTVQESTVALNTAGRSAAHADQRANPATSGIEVVAGELTEIDTITDGNTCYAFPTGQIKDGLNTGDGHLNLTFPATATCPGIIADPQLGPLDYNGGPTQTMTIAPSSPAHDRIPPTTLAGCTPTDQRGIPRPQPAGGRCDIGAYEYQP